MIRVRRRGLTVVEVLVALALFALLSAATAGVLATALRLQAEAGRVAVRIAAFGPVAAGVDADGGSGSGVPSCSAAGAGAGDGEGGEVGGAGAPCLHGRTRCRVRASGDAVCDGTGPVLRSDWGWAGPDGTVPAVTAWTWAP